jgi:hypothetical protein
MDGFTVRDIIPPSLSSSPATILFKSTACLALMYRKLGEAKLLPRIERFSQMEGLRQRRSTSFPWPAAYLP